VLKQVEVGLALRQCGVGLGVIGEVDDADRDALMAATRCTIGQKSALPSVVPMVTTSPPPLRRMALLPPNSEKTSPTTKATATITPATTRLRSRLGLGGNQS